MGALLTTFPFSPAGILDSIYGTSKNFKRMMAEAQARHDGDYQKASQEIMGSLAKWEAEREEKDRERDAAPDSSSETSSSTSRDS